MRQESQRCGRMGGVTKGANEMEIEAISLGFCAIYARQLLF